ncbi:hypothetical protein AOL_s00215g511 [Orbilia oligospora ATCC 24927]|uniref:Uncharacterized protein n=1 Tax=Arthrobotrys oligospora (strain ATCC 24927 / CBS 115.81 / DSM 1491) TaxID=756982 RepID=G1XT13_ARTOA|nr:hypothetical protein AOL_s00215g511 [Orbilia oligospora ATCC 24927]EGX43775.1 hypothetical protein AOL_s00215g511 [Orbilia oligospora ATCC 24927]
MAAIAAGWGDCRRIYHLSKTCETLLTDLLSVLSQNQNTQTEFRVVQEYLQQFECWAGYLGVFAPPQASLDSRLQYMFDAEDQVLRLLELVEKNARHAHAPIAIKLTERPSAALWNLGLIIESARTNDSDRGLSGTGKTEAPRAQSDDSMRTRSSILLATQAALDGINGALGRLQRLGVVIKKASAPDLFIRGQNFAEKHSDDYHLFERMSLIYTYVRNLYPNIEDSLVRQLSTSISSRRQRLLHLRKHQASVENTDIRFLFEPAGLDQTMSQRLKRIGDVFSAAQSSDLGISFVGPGLAIAGSFLTKGIAKKSLGYPYRDPPANPTPQKEQTQCKCNWCFRLLEDSHGAMECNNLWRSHLEEDFQPYVCISEECGEEPVCFASLHEWQRHMDGFHTEDWTQEIHKPTVWYCDLDNHEFIEFPTAEEFYIHLESHEGEVTITRLERMAKRNFLSASRGPNFCPFCTRDISTLDPELDEKATEVLIREQDHHTPIRARSTRPGRPFEGAGFQRPEGHTGFTKRGFLSTAGATSEGRSSKRGSRSTNRLPEGLSAHAALTKHIGLHLLSLAISSMQYLSDRFSVGSRSESCSTEAQLEISSQGNSRRTDNSDFVVRSPLPFQDPFFGKMEKDNRRVVSV